jgi:hypothetical protein
MSNYWDDVIRQCVGAPLTVDREELRESLSRGVPPSHRAQVWMAISGASTRQERSGDLYYTLVQRSRTTRPHLADDIDRHNLICCKHRADLLGFVFWQGYPPRVSRQPGVQYSREPREASNSALRLLFVAPLNQLWTEHVLPHGLFADANRRRRRFLHAPADAHLANA